MLENFSEDKRKNSMTQFSDFHTGWSIESDMKEVIAEIKNMESKFESKFSILLWLISAIGLMIAIFKFVG